MKSESQKNWIELFKYNAILSAIFFLGSTIYLSSKLPNYSFTKYTISQMSYFLNPTQLSFFNLLFILKCLVDLSFTYYVFKKFNLKFYHPTSVVWLIAVLSFGLIGFFPVHNYFYTHWILAISLFLFWTISEYVFARITKDSSFISFTYNLILIQITSTLLLIGLNQLNAIPEIVYFLLALIWQVIFIGKYL